MSCASPEKVRHADEAAAWVHAKALRRRGASVDVKPYRCGSHWHVGHSQASLGYRIRSAFRRKR